MAQPELAWSTRGFCGYTNIGEGSACEATDRKGHWEVGGYITPSGFLYACLSMCKKCERCNYISVSHKAADCSWYHSCELQGSKHVELVRHSYQVRQHGAVVGRVERLLQRHVQNTSFESEGIRLVSMSPAAVCFGAQCVSWAAAGAASRGPGGWVGALPSRVSVEAQASCGIRNDCRPQQTCGSCIDEAATKGAVFERTLALQAKQTRLITQHTLKACSTAAIKRGWCLRSRSRFAQPLHIVRTRSIYMPSQGRSGRRPTSIARGRPSLGVPTALLFTSTLARQRGTRTAW